jgi:hypothetical protein
METYKAQLQRRHSCQTTKPASRALLYRPFTGARQHSEKANLDIPHNRFASGGAAPQQDGYTRRSFLQVATTGSAPTVTDAMLAAAGK